MPGAMLREGFGRAPAVIRAASLPAIRARAESSAGLKYKAASDNVCKSQVVGGQGEIARPRFCSTKDRSSESARFRDSNREAVALATIGAAWYRCAAHPAKDKIPARGTSRFQIASIKNLLLNFLQFTRPSGPRTPLRAQASAPAER